VFATLDLRPSDPAVMTFSISTQVPPKAYAIFSDERWRCPKRIYFGGI
jgi:hypothetical protein